MPRALVVGGTGQIGLATARRLLGSGWDVDLTGRNPDRLPAEIAAAGARFLASDRRDPSALAAAFGSGAELLLDCACYTAADAELLLPLARAADSTVMISTKAVYVDDEGNHSNSERPPRYLGPIHETQRTLPPGSRDYLTAEGYGENKVAAEQVLLDDGAPVSVLRPSKVHGAVVGESARMGLREARPRPAPHRGAREPGRGRRAHNRGRERRCAGGDRRRQARSADPEQRRPGRAERPRDLTCRRQPPRPRVAGGAGRRRRGRPDALGCAASDRARHDRRPRARYAPAGDYAATVVEEVEWLVAAARGSEGAGASPGTTTSSSHDSSTTRPRIATSPPGPAAKSPSRNTSCRRGGRPGRGRSRDDADRRPAKARVEARASSPVTASSTSRDFPFGASLGLRPRHQLLVRLRGLRVRSDARAASRSRRDAAGSASASARPGRCRRGSPSAKGREHESATRLGLGREPLEGLGGRPRDWKGSMYPTEAPPATQSASTAASESRLARSSAPCNRRISICGVATSRSLANRH